VIAMSPPRETAPIVFVATNRVKPGRAAAERARVPDLVAFLEEAEKQLLAFHEYLDEDGTVATVVQVHPDSASVERHLRTVAERAAAAYAETLDATLHIQIYGPLDPNLLASFRAQTGDAVEVTIATEHLGGFTRSP
jgi:hypothetical protein